MKSLALALLFAGAAFADEKGALWLGPKPPAKCERVVTVAPSLTDTVLKLGAASALVGVSRFDDDAAVAKLPRVGGFTDPSVESVVALEPQLLIVQKSPGNRQAVEKIAELGIPVLALPLTTIADVLEAIRLIGDAVGHAAEAKTLIAHIDDARAKAREAAKARKRPAHVMLVYGFKPLVVAGPGSFADELLVDVGAVNVAAKAPTPYPVFSVERAVAFAPDVVVDCSDAADGRVELKALLKKSRWVELKSRALLQPGPSLADGLKELEAALYGSP